MMIKLLKTILRPFWRMTAPLRRPLVRKVDNHLIRLISLASHEMIVHACHHAALEGSRIASCEAIGEHALPPILPRLDEMRGTLGRIEESVNIGRHIAHEHASDTNLLLDSLVREVTRLQMQIELMRRTVVHSEEIGELGIVGDRKAG